MSGYDKVLEVLGLDFDDYNAGDDEPLRMAAERIDHLEQQLRWRDVTEELPDYDEYVLWRTEQGHYSVWEIDKDMDWEWVKRACGYGTENSNMPTHWKPITPPGEE